jgi:4-oxalocrotonate tautomerase
MNVLGSGPEARSVVIEEIEPDKWTEQVYVSDIQSKWDKLYKKPGCDPLKK